MIQTKTWEVIIADAPHHEDLYAEIWIDNKHLGEIYLENDSPVIEIFPRELNQPWKISYTDLLEALKEVDNFLKSMEISSMDYVRE